MYVFTHLLTINPNLHWFIPVTNQMFKMVSSQFFCFTGPEYTLQRWLIYIYIHIYTIIYTYTCTNIIYIHTLHVYINTYRILLSKWQKSSRAKLPIRVNSRRILDVNQNQTSFLGDISIFLMLTSKYMHPSQVINPVFDCWPPICLMFHLLSHPLYLLVHPVRE